MSYITLGGLLLFVLAKILSNFAHTPFEVQEGTFQSIEGYWYWLLFGNDDFRKLYGPTAKKLGKEIRQQLAGIDNSDEEKLSSSPEFRKKIKTAITIEILFFIFSVC